MKQNNKIENKSTARKRKAGLILKEEYRIALESLSDEACGQLIKVLIVYQFDEISPTKLSPELRMAFKFLKPLLDTQKSDYIKKCIQNSQNIQNYWDGVKAKEAN